MKRLRGILNVGGLAGFIVGPCFWMIHHGALSVRSNSEYLPFYTSRREDDSSSKLCGTYRGYTYVGFRCQYDSSPLLGLMWYKPLSPRRERSQRTKENISSSSLQSRLRHECTHDDQLERFGWNQHDGRSFGRQDITDPQNQVNLTVQWVYLGADFDEEMTAPLQFPFGKQQRSQLRWALRVRGDRYHREYDGIQDSESNIHDVSLLWYVATQDNLTSTYHPSEGIIRGNDYRVWINPSSTSSHPIYMDDRTNATKEYNATYFAAFQVPPSQHYNPKPTILQELRNPTSSLPPHLFDPQNLYRAATARTGNQVIQQVFFNLPFEVDFHFSHEESTTRDKRDLEVEGGTEVAERYFASKVSRDGEWKRVTRALEDARDNFERVFAETFIHNPQRQNNRAPSEKGIEHSNESPTAFTAWSEEQTQTGHYALGNMLSSITYMHGDRQVYEMETDRIVIEPSLSGWTVVPDRPDHAQGMSYSFLFCQVGNIAN
jgi:hypothetical protein